jgi:hypothetical protein
MGDNIIKDYVENDFSIERLCAKYKCGKIKIKQILLENGVEIKKKGGQLKNVETPYKVDLTKNVDNQFELSRFTTHSDYIVSGLGSKMLKFFIGEYNPKSIISFADRRWTNPNNNMYIKMGFKIVSITPPDYKYYNSKINKYKRYHKFGLGKRNLLKKYPDIDINKSEKVLTEELGFDKIWDCGLLKYQYDIK